MTEAEPQEKPFSSNIDLDPLYAKTIITNVGSSGQPPIYGYQFFTAGIAPYLNTLENEYLATYIKSGGSAFKLVIGTYGGGKTHFLYSVQDVAWKYNYITSYIEMSADSTPFHKLETVYKAIVSNLMYQQEPQAIFDGYDRGIEALLKSWFHTKMGEFSENAEGEALDKIVSQYLKNFEGYESSSFQNAIRNSFIALRNEQDDDFELLVQWLKGENVSKPLLKRFNIFETITKQNAFKMIRCIIRWIGEVGYSGLVVLMDEAEKKAGLTTKEKETQLLNLREVVDACSNQTIKKTLLLYAVPDDTFLEGRTGVYQALTDRLSSVFEGDLNPTGVRIVLEQLENVSGSPESILEEIGMKLAIIYQHAYNVSFDENMIKEHVRKEAVNAYSEKFGEIGYKRLFVKNCIKEFHSMRVALPKPN